ncbi:hypothetical protein DPMN_171695 [Dreissena polymorpha]|uniref:Uncharacterized protein n=1 Tax=Dreissena polymorpha TaxID=45954 RepID=A0A9D4DZL5_DREPO|nr:hypothetical protein DPMN_171695 [Dreissena polymorpha]
MQETLHDHHTPITIGGRPISNLRFTADINLISGTIINLQYLTHKLYKKQKLEGCGSARRC